MAELFYQTVHTVNAADYSPEQLAVWATGQVNLESWNRSFLEHHTLVATDTFTLISGTGINDFAFRVTTIRAFHKKSSPLRCKSY